MIRALGNGVSGLNNHQIKMDVIGNNIANVNTIAYKKGRVTFNEVLGQEFQSSGRSPGGEPTNPSYIGLGIHVGTIDQAWTQGPLENTNLPTDFAINGDGFFIARSGPQYMLSRAGNFVLNNNGNLISSSGLPIQGFAIDPTTGEPDLTALEDIYIDLNTKASPEYTSSMAVTGNLDAGLSNNGGVDPDTFAMSSFVYDEQGTKHNVTYTFTKTSADGADPDTFDVSVESDNTLQPFGAVPLTFEVGFGTDGTLQEIDGVSVNDPAFTLPALSWDTGFVNDTGTDTVSLDLTALTHFQETSSALVSSQNGKPSGQLVGFRTTNDGVIQLNFDSGYTKDVFQIALGKVANNGGLTQQGENVYSTTSVSGEIQFGRAGTEVNAAIISGTLEMSNVELATEFSDMIKTQRGFQASARVIRTADEILTETINLKR